MKGNGKPAPPELQALVGSYEQAFNERNVDACVACFSEDATLKFLFAVYKGTDAIRQWHSDRFAADVRILNVGPARVEGDSITVDAEATSKRLRLFRIDTVKGTIHFRVLDERFVEVSFAPRRGIASHANWHFR